MKIFTSNNIIVKLNMLKAEKCAAFNENRAILASAVLSQYTRVTDNVYENSKKLQ